ncbi:MAG: DUF4389 domain-containing protein [Pseudonocardia sp.]|uniref:DUF4389 domain-containing protein n=1 Tax=unclassified Pseudonocardia TaxID=2619320 RepID=UPI00086D3476|nr:MULTISPECIES: DUF4389 domain-containing protein [unclassified Pseudonocardia]MBN9107161.1 DUF4389 domain-containing protein [Pseudonocardia sp.]ODU26356.1 MAG: hypothetical protein ABS80_07305 [Pseudonocardia sp. SCN 72-51]ODV02692.1 MAG: hypothetical protein ABT15_24730 [Pseudonocardia sp. SCN 73-27]
MSNTPQPVHVSGRLDPHLSRGLWLVKWLLLIPHLVVIALLWVAFVVLSIVALVAILVTGRYPRALFGFNLGVLRWTWRVGFYGYAVAGTDRYPPFTLRDDPDHPARLDIEFPERLSRPKALFKWWLLAIPHYLVVVLLVGAGRTTLTGNAATTAAFGIGLIGVLVLIALVALLFTGRYPGGIFDAVMGMNRWVLRVVAYAALMTDAYPPFRLDQGGDERVAPEVEEYAPDADAVPDPRPDTGAGRTPSVESHGRTVVMTPPVPLVRVSDSEPAGAGHAIRARSVPPPSAGRSLLLVVGSLITGLAVLLAVGGIAGLVADRAARDAGGFLATNLGTTTTGGVALRTDSMRIDVAAPGTVARVVGEVALRATSNGGGDVFVGVGPTTDVSQYLSGAAQGVWRTGTVDGRRVTGRVDEIAGRSAVSPPGEQSFWVAQASGPGTTTATWTPVPGDWTAVVMNADGSAPVSAGVQLGAQLPVLGLAATAAVWTALGLFVVGVAVVVGAASSGRRTPQEVSR